VAAHASDAIDAALSPWERLQVRAHTFFCRNCRTYFEQIAQTAMALREAPRRELSAEAREKLKARLRSR
jgi:anti-sigma factor RsiW